MDVHNLLNRTKRFALQIIKMFASLPKIVEAQVIGRQALRPGTAFAIVLLLCLSSVAAAEERFGVAVYPGSEYDQARTKLLKDSLSVQGAAYRTRDGMAKVTEFLIQSGHRKIGFVKGEENNRNADDRFEGFLETLAKHQIEPDHNWIFNGNFDVDSGRDALRAFNKHTEKPTVVICANDLMAIGFMLEAKNSGVRIPEDFSVIGFDGIEAAQMITPTLTTVRQHLIEMGYTACKMLIKRIESRDHPVEGRIFNALLD